MLVKMCSSDMNATPRENGALSQLSGSAQKNGISAFTLIELLVVIAIIAILASLLMPALVVSKMKAQGSYCLGNLKELSLGWEMYSQDFNDFLAPNSDN